MITVAVIALGLALDAFAVSLVVGAGRDSVHCRRIFLLAVSFGVFQSAMPVAGWFLGQGVSSIVAAINYWIAFGLLAGIGVKMIYESFQLKGMPPARGNLAIGVILALSVAVSIDALAVGLGLGLLNMTIVFPVILFGVVTFILSVVGAYIGRRLGHLFESWIEIAGGLVLVAIGLRILLSHFA